MVGHTGADKANEGTDPMLWLILGLLIFLGVHSVRIVADDWRNRAIARVGEGPWKGAYSLLSLAGLALIVAGYAEARLQPVPVWAPPAWTRHAAALLSLPAFVLLVAAYVPGNHFKARLDHPMLLAVIAWALAHLLSNGFLADLLLFGGFLLWAMLAYGAARRRGGLPPSTTPSLARDVVVLVAGVAAWAAFAVGLHARLIGVAPFG